MTSTAPVAAGGAATIDSAQQNSFNPSWMRSTFNGGGNAASVRSPKSDCPAAAPVFVKNRYGREDMLALMGDAVGHPPPEGLQNCPFYVEEALPPIVCYPLSELEQRLQQNINSSKAMSSLSHAERANVATGAAYGGAGEGGPAGHKGGAGGWTPVKQWNRGHPPAGAQVKGGTSRPYVPPARNGIRGENANTTPEQPQLTPFGQRFANRGRGAQSTARGGGVTGAAFNSRAQGLYDPRDPKDRPRNRMRSTSDEGDVAGEGGWTTAGVGKHGWTHKDGGQGAWSGGQGGNAQNNDGPEESHRKSESGSMPEWMEDGEDREREESSDDTTSATGSFDEHGRFQKKNHPAADAAQGRRAPDVHSNKHEKSQQSSAEKQPTGMQGTPQATASPSREAGSSNPDVDNSQGYSSLRPQVDMSAYRPPVVPQQSMPGGGVPMAAPPAAIHPPQFFYLDPTKQERGPFEKLQMDSWYKRGYFTEGLEVRRHTDTKYRTLGELMQLNGRMTPFDYKDDVAPPPPPVTAVFSNPAQSFATLFASGGMWSELGAQANMMYSQAGYDPIAAERKRIEDEQRRILEEQAKMREYQEHLVRELQKQREEQEKQLMEQKLALIKHQEEIERRERELKESAEETKARLEMERLALAEKARQIEEERIAKIEEEARKAEEIRAQELERKRQEEELERQRKAEKEELIRKQQEAERERRAKEAAEEAARNARAAAEAAAEKLRQQQAELQKKRKAAEEHNRKLAAAQAAAEKEKTANKTFEIEEAWQAAPKPVLSTQTSNDGSGQAAKKSSASKVAPWSAAAAAAPPKEKSLKEIQEEEERQLRAEQAQQARLRKEQETVNLHASGTWSNASQRIQWNQAAQPAPAVVKPANAKPAWGGAGVEPQKTATSPFWDGPPLQAANKVAPAESAKKTANKGAAAKTEAKTIANEKAAKRALGMGEDNSVFLQWVVQRLKQLNSAVEADVLAVFIEGVENPDDVEDYVIGYLGDSKPVKEFVKEFLQKRCDFRNRKQHAVKDDLSSARGAPVSGNGAGFSAVQSKKKKNKGARLVVDGSCLGFRATSDPNRVNQGEIETVTLAPGQKR